MAGRNGGGSGREGVASVRRGLKQEKCPSQKLGQSVCPSNRLKPKDVRELWVTGRGNGRRGC